MTISKDFISLFLLMLAISVSNKVYSNSKIDCKSIYGTWLSIDEYSDTTIHHFHDDNQLVIYTIVEDSCVLNSIYKFDVIGDTLITKFRLDDWHLPILKLDCDTLIYTQGRYSNNELIVFRHVRIDGHYCVDSKVPEMTLSKMLESDNILGFLRVAWLLIVFWFFSLLIFIRHIFNFKFIWLVLKRWIPITFVAGFVMYYSAYGLYETDPVFSWMKKGEIDYGFVMSKLRWQYGSGSILKSTNEFWTRAFLVNTIIILPPTIWSAWSGVISTGKWYTRPIIFINYAVYGFSLIGNFSIMVVSSLVSPSGPRDFLMLVITYLVLLYVSSRPLGKEMKGTHDFLSA